MTMTAKQNEEYVKARIAKAVAKGSDRHYYSPLVIPSQGELTNHYYVGAKIGGVKYPVTLSVTVDITGKPEMTRSQVISLAADELREKVYKGWKSIYTRKDAIQRHAENSLKEENVNVYYVERFMNYQCREGVSTTTTEVK